MNQHADVIVVGGGAGGICAAVAAARTGAKTMLLEAAPQVGGTGVFSTVSLICRFHNINHQPINMGIHRELFFEAYRYSTHDRRASAPRLTYDEKVLASRYHQIIAAEPLLTVHTNARVASVETKNRRIISATLENGKTFTATAWVDGTADGNLAQLAGCDTMWGRDTDGAVKRSNLVFTLSGIDKTKLKNPDYTTRGGLDSLWAELTAVYQKAKAHGKTINPRSTVLCFPYPDGERLLFNSNEVLGVDVRESMSVEQAKAKGRQMIDELVAIIREHRAFANASVDHVASKMGIREGRRVVGDYVLNETDCLKPACFDDMVAACAYEIDIHDPDGGPARMTKIPEPGYYHIPLRSLIAKDLDNLALGSRCISGTHEAHSSYRVISGVTAIGQAAGTTAALAARFQNGKVRQIPSSEVRYVLHQQIQFVEGDLKQPAGYEVPMSM